MSNMNNIIRQTGLFQVHLILKHKRSQGTVKNGYFGEKDNISNSNFKKFMILWAKDNHNNSNFRKFIMIVFV